MLQYILQTIAFQVFFLVVYDLFLKKETFFNWNRGYLLLTSILSFVLPFVKIKALQGSIPHRFNITLPEIVFGAESNQLADTILLDTIVITSQSVSYLQWLFYIGLSISLLLFGLKLYRILKLIYKNPKTKDEGFSIVNLLKSNAAFSFLNYIFIGDTIAKDEAIQILEHEKIHVQQKHTLDLLYFETLRILFWFNPLIYIYQNRTSELHEFIADAKVAKQQSKKDYYQNLLSQIFDTKKVSFINTFFKQSLIKKRIIMLSKQKSKQILKLKYALLIPLVFGMIVYTSCSQTTEVETEIAVEGVEGTKSTLISKIGAMKQQIEIQGNVNDHEMKGFDLLLRTIKGDKKDETLIREIQAYQATKNESTLTSRIVGVFEQIQKQGNISDDEYRTLKTVMMLTSPDGFSDPFFQDVVEYAEIPYGVIEQVPVFPGCESVSKEEQKKCMSQNVAKLVAENFNTKVGKEQNITGRQKIYVSFKITNTGDVEDIKARASSPVLEKEAERVVALLPKMKPGMQEGKAVNVPYSLPIVFQINE